MNLSAIPVSRRAFLKASAALGGALTVGTFPGTAIAAGAAGGPGFPVSALPKGAAPAPLGLPHFPNRLTAFIWRNWPLVPVERMAKVVGASPSDLQRIASAMGMGKQRRVSIRQQARSYITIIKRNWHLLPYEQLLQLLGWSAEQLDYTLREDDFLFVKLGNLKPQCELLRYAPLDPAALARVREISGILEEEFPRLEAPGPEPLFGFLERFSQAPRARSQAPASKALKFCYSYFALYGDPLLETETDPYPDGYLAHLARVGVNGIWLQAVLYKLAPFPWEPERSAHYEQRLRNLARLVRRAKKHGMQVFLYLNEPRAMPLRFFEKRPYLKGAPEGDYAALCTSVPEVQEFIVRAVALICRAVPGLGGFFSISASENLSNCWSHGGGAGCPRCSTRPAPEVIAEVNRLFHQGIVESGTSARLIAWDWGWDDRWAGEAIDRLPEGVSLMSVSEWRLPIRRGEVATEVGEYSISAVGPGPRAQRHWQLARQRGLKTIAKIQAGNTWELSSVPYIPALENVARHIENLLKANVDGYMLGWTLGGYPSPNLEMVSEVLACGSAEQAMTNVATRRFGKTLASAVTVAWSQVSAAFREFPYHGGVLYSAPQQLGPANLLYAEPTRYKASMVGFPYDDLDSWRAVYPPEVFVQQLNKVADGFSSTLDRLKATAATAAPRASMAELRALDEECRIIEAVAIHFKSAANQAKFVMARKALAGTNGPAARRPLLREMELVLRDEIVLARRLWQIQSADSRIGFEASNQYYYIPLDLMEKILNCREILARLPALANGA